MASKMFDDTLQEWRPRSVTYLPRDEWTTTPGSELHIENHPILEEFSRQISGPTQIHSLKEAPSRYQVVRLQFESVQPDPSPKEKNEGSRSDGPTLIGLRWSLIFKSFGQQEKQQMVWKGGSVSRTRYLNWHDSVMWSCSMKSWIPAASSCR